MFHLFIEETSIRHPLPILNISEHLTRLKLQQNTHSPFGVFLIQRHNVKLTGWPVLGGLLGTQIGREVEIVTTFELAVKDDGESVDLEFLVSRRDQCEYVHAFIITCN